MLSLKMCMKDALVAVYRKAIDTWVHANLSLGSSQLRGEGNQKQGLSSFSQNDETQYLCFSNFSMVDIQ